MVGLRFPYDLVTLGKWLCLFESHLGYKNPIVLHSLSHVQLFVTPWTAAQQASLSFTVSWNLLVSIELVMLSNHLIFCCPLLLLLSVFPSIRVFYN